MAPITPKSPWQLCLFTTALAVSLCCLSATSVAASVGKWRRHVVTLDNSTYTGNPFELEVDGVFTHVQSGETIRMPGYYAGSDQWRVAFMPTKVGTWTYTTISSDPELNEVEGSVDCVASGLPGMLASDPEHLGKWKYSDGDHAVPIALRMPIFSEPATVGEFEAAADFLQQNNIHLMETRLLEEYGQFGGRYDFVFEGDWRDHRFDLDVWDRMDERMEILTSRGLGAHVMFYSDDGGKPSWSGRSDTERLVIRYAVARLAAYPVVWFNSGIDVSEYRSCAAIDWMGTRLGELDPYNHPRSSRPSGSELCEMANQTFSSEGYPLQARVDDMIDHFLDHSVPVSMDDAWGENRGSTRFASKDHSEHDIRRAFWKAVIAGGVGGLIRGSGDGGSRNGMYYINHVASDLESEQWLRLINPYLRDRFGEVFGEMVPDTSIVENGYAISNPDKTHMLFLLIGEEDRWDPTDGGPVTVDLNGLSDSYTARWFDPRTGEEIDAGSVQGGDRTIMTAPTNDDWVLSVISDASPRGLSPLWVQDVRAPNDLVVYVTFNAPVDEASASNPANYVISGGTTEVTITDAVRPTKRKVVLWTQGLVPGETYTLTTANVRDLATRTNTVRDGSMSFTVHSAFGCQASARAPTGQAPLWVFVLLALFLWRRYSAGGRDVGDFASLGRR